jgi:hypothetical protein
MKNSFKILYMLVALIGIFIIPVSADNFICNITAFIVDDVQFFQFQAMHFRTLGLWRRNQLIRKVCKPQV